MTREIDPVEISYEKWSVLQVDSHSDQLGAYGTYLILSSLTPGPTQTTRVRE